MATPRFIKNPSGPVLGVTDIPVLKVDGLYFKDMERTGSLLPYEDWRLPAKERARDLASRLSVEDGSQPSGEPFCGCLPWEEL